MLDRALLARYLRQRLELGERELMLEGLSAGELVRVLSSSPGTAEGGRGGVGERACSGDLGSGAGTAERGSGRVGERGSSGDLGSGAGRTSSGRHAAPVGALDAAARAAMLREVLGGAEAPARGAAARPAGAADSASAADVAVPREGIVAANSARAGEVPNTAAGAAGGAEVADTAADAAVAADRAASPDVIGAAQPIPHSPPPPLSRSAGGRDISPPSTSLQALAMEATACTACALAGSRRHVVFGEGNPEAELVVVGEAPGQEEDRTGRPFVGQAGKLLNLLLLAAGFARESVYICNTLKCRPPQNRNPLPGELAACSGFLKGQLGAIRPRVLLAVGKFAAQSLVGSDESISRLRGRVFRYEDVPLVVTYHPAFLLRSPQWTRTAWEDLQLARKVLDEQA